MNPDDLQRRLDLRAGAYRGGLAGVTLAEVVGLAALRVEAMVESRLVPVAGELVLADPHRALLELPEREARACGVWGRLLTLRDRPVRLTSWHPRRDVADVDAAVAAAIAAALVEVDLEDLTRDLVALPDDDPRFRQVCVEQADGPGMIVVERPLAPVPPTRR